MEQTSATMKVYSNGEVHIPACAKESLGIGYNDKLAVTMEVENLDNDIEEVTFHRNVTAAGRISVPANILQEDGTRGEERDFSFRHTGKGWDKETPTGTRGGNRVEF